VLRISFLALFAFFLFVIFIFQARIAPVIAAPLAEITIRAVMLPCPCVVRLIYFARYSWYSYESHINPRLKQRCRVGFSPRCFAKRLYL
jgi:hypothetical protein